MNLTPHNRYVLIPISGGIIYLSRDEPFQNFEHFYLPKLVGQLQMNFENGTREYNIYSWNRKLNIYTDFARESYVKCLRATHICVHIIADKSIPIMTRKLSVKCRHKSASDPCCSVISIRLAIIAFDVYPYHSNYIHFSVILHAYNIIIVCDNCNDRVSSNIVDKQPFSET